ncbi:MAG: hypothetical protein GY811_10690 [Myxococcales bacterium]|nr:hypothetical protein [Myxococcales bacterium]
MVKAHIRATLALVAMSSLALSACSKDPYDPQTWIEKLGEGHEIEETLTTLERLKCPEAIKPLGKFWEKHNKDSRVLRIMINLADQPEMVKGHNKFPNQDCTDAGEGPYWEDALPYLITAVEDFDVTDEREIQDAAISAEALGKAKATDTIQVLISAATKQQKLRQGQMVRIAAVKALGGYGDNARAVETVIKVLETEAKRETLRLNAAAANALAESGSPSAIVPLLKALYEISPIYQQVRTAITTIGAPAVPELIKVFNGTHAKMNKLADKNNFAKDCDKGEGLGTTCIAPGNLRFKAATLLGDMRATEAIGTLTAALSEKPAVSFFAQSGAPGPSDHNAIIDALRKMGAYASADVLSTYMKAEATDDMIRPLAIDAYSMLAKDTKALGFLKKALQDQGNEMPMRQASTLAYARLVKTDEEIAPIQAVIDLQLKNAKENLAKVGKAKTEGEKKDFTGKANDFFGFAREYEQHRTRARAGVVCKNDVACYQELLTLDAKGVVEKLKIPNHHKDAASKPMKKQDMQTYRIAALERALLEIAKMGKAAEPAFKDLLKHAESTDRIIRQGVLLALVQVAPTPCNECVRRLESIITAQRAQTTLDNLTSDTRIVKNFFVSAGGKLGGAAKPAAPAPAE